MVFLCFAFAGKLCESKAMRFLILFTLLFAGMFSVSSAHAYDDASWNRFLDTVQSRAAAEGVRASVINDAIATMDFDPTVIKKDRKQPEKTITFKQYRKGIVSAARINEGRDLMQSHARMLAGLSSTYGVQPQYMLALWAVESNYGAIQGRHNLLVALGSLAYEGRRREFFMNELMAVLKIMDRQGRRAADMTGSWAGAMGMVQFMPTTYLKYAADGDGDGHADIWSSYADALASAANYLAHLGWNPNQRWGRAVSVPKDFPKSLVGRKHIRPLSFFAKAGIRQKDGAPLPDEDINAAIVAPDGLSGPTFVVYDNYQAIMDWNRSDYFATSIGLLADAIAQNP